jgi:murein peptide amidase A
MNREYIKEIGARLRGLRPAMKVGTIGSFSDGCRDYEIPYVIAESGSGNRKKEVKTVFLSAGIHGDEVAGVYAVLDFLENDIKNYLDSYSFTCLPCINPSGFEIGTRCNYQGLDLNRDFNRRCHSQEARLVKRFLHKKGTRYLFCLNAHEDPTDTPVEDCTLDDNPREFYLYLVSPDKRLGRSIIRKVEDSGVQVCKWKKIYGEKAHKGMVWWYGAGHYLYSDVNTLEHHFLNYSENSIAPETPTCWPLEQRITAHKVMINSTLESMMG